MEVLSFSGNCAECPLTMQHDSKLEEITQQQKTAGAGGSSRSRLPVWPPSSQLQVDGDAPPPPEINVYGLIF